MKYDVVPVTRFDQNCSILWCEATRKAAIVDPGGNVDQITDYLKWENLQAEVILLTHGHIDHAGGVVELAALTGARIEGPHLDDAALLNGLQETGLRYGIRAQRFASERWLKDGDQIQFGEEILAVFHCPGHTRGHVAYFSAASRTAFVGDILFRHAIGAWKHADGNFLQLVNSIRLKLFPLGDDVRFVPGHGDESHFGHEKAANPFVGDAAIAKFPDHLRAAIG